jgi:predicted RNA binding protein YcfA (HicA-like mRNA interferase family)
MLSDLVARHSRGTNTGTSGALSDLSTPSSPEFLCSRGGGAVEKLNAVTLIRLLGWYATDQGKGGHTVYKHEDSDDIITIPSDAELSYRVQKTTADTLGMTHHEFQEAARKPRKWLRRQAQAA